MLFDLGTSTARSTSLDMDVCIIGAGAAGLTIARELANRSLRVALVEGGGLRGDVRAQALLRGESVGRAYFPLEQVRISGFGGTTAIWNGACRPLDALDFLTRDWVPWSGWPIARQALDPYYLRAQAVCELGPYAYDVDDWETPREQRLPLCTEAIDTHIFQLSKTRFGRVYREAVTAAPNILTCLRAHAMEIETDAEGRTATSVLTRTLDGRELRIHARIFVVAAGGIETPRLLLLSRGLGNQHDLVGRFFTEHLYMDSGELTLANGWGDASLYAIHASAKGVFGTRIEAVLALSDRAQQREGLLRAAFLFPPRWRTGSAYYSPSVTSLLHVVRLLRQGHVPYQWQKHVRAIAGGLGDVMTAARRRRGEKVTTNHPNRVARAFAEQAPNYDSRVSLSERRDALGRNLIKLDWRVRDEDLRSLRRAHEILAAELQRTGLGRFEPHLDVEDRLWPARVTGGYHHMGTTRMHADPRQGVVDTDSRVHGTSNVYVAGSSVFPTSGYANPTLTIVALSIRLADHLRAVLA